MMSRYELLGYFVVFITLLWSPQKMPTELSAFLMTQMFITLHLLHMQFLHTKNLHLPAVVWVPTLKNL